MKKYIYFAIAILLFITCSSARIYKNTVYTKFSEALEHLSDNQKLIVLFTTHSSSSRKFEDNLLADSNIVRIVKDKNYLLVVLNVDDKKIDNMQILRELFKTSDYPSCGVINKKQSVCSKIIYNSNNVKLELIEMLNMCIND